MSSRGVDRSMGPHVSRVPEASDFIPLVPWQDHARVPPIFERPPPLLPHAAAHPPEGRHALKRPIRPRPSHHHNNNHIGNEGCSMGLQHQAAWIPINKIYPQGVLGLHEEVEDFFQWMVPTREEHELRLHVKHRVEEAVRSVWPNARVESFGSFRTGLYLPTSDIDLVLFGRWDVLPLRAIERLLIERNIARPDSIKVLEKATVPIVKFSDSLSGMSVDISFNMTNCLRAVELIKHFKKCFPPLPKLIYVLKQFLLQRDLNEVFTGGLSSYALTLLVVSFLQLHPRDNASALNANLGVLLLEFFEHYGRNFNYLQTAIRIRDGGSLVSKDAIQSQLPVGMGPGMMCIEDPLDPCNDVGRSSYGAMNVKQAFERAFVVLCDLVRPSNNHNFRKKSVLSHIIVLPTGVQDYRRWVCKTAPLLHLAPALASDEEQAPPSRATITPISDVTPKNAPEELFFGGVSRGEQFDEARDRRALSSNSKGRDSTSKTNRSKRSESSTRSLRKTVTSNQSSDSECESGGAAATTTAYTAPSTATATPSSAMSISPASSEVGSLKSRLKEASSKLIEASMMNLEGKEANETDSQDVESNNSSSSKNRPTYWAVSNKKSNAMIGQRFDRSDLDSDWRSAPKSQQEGLMRGRIDSESKSRKGVNVSSAIRHRADHDTNWRHRSKTSAPSAKENESDNISKSRSGSNDTTTTKIPFVSKDTSTINDQSRMGDSDVDQRTEGVERGDDAVFDSCGCSVATTTTAIPATTTKGEKGDVSRPRSSGGLSGKRRKKNARKIQQRRPQQSNSSSSHGAQSASKDDDEVNRSNNQNTSRFSSQCGLLKPNR